MRVRTRNNLKSNPSSFQYIAELAGCPGNRFSVASNYPGAKVGTREEMRDVVTPKWYALKKRQGKQKTFVVNPMQKITVGITSSGTSASTELINPTLCSGGAPNKNQSICAGDYFTSWLGGYVGNEPSSSGFLLSEGDIKGLIVEASTACRANVKSGNANLLVDIGEMRQTYEMFASPFKGFNKLMKSWDRNSSLGFSQRVKRVLDTVVFGQSKKLTDRLSRPVSGSANLYMLYRYGISPLISSIQSVVEQLNKKSYAPYTTARGKSRAISRQTDTLVILDGKFKLDVTRTTSHEVKVRAFSIDRYEMSWQIALGLTPQNIPAAILDLTKFSFVVNWFVNIADYLSAITPRLDLVNLAEGYVVEDVFVISYEITNATIAPTWIATHKWIGNPPSGTAVVQRITKTRAKGLLGPSLMVKGDFKFYRPTRVLDALALAIQHGKKFLRAIK